MRKGGGGDGGAPPAPLRIGNGRSGGARGAEADAERGSASESRAVDARKSTGRRRRRYQRPAVCAMGSSSAAPLDFYLLRHLRSRPRQRRDLGRPRAARRRWQCAGAREPRAVVPGSTATAASYPRRAAATRRSCGRATTTSGCRSTCRRSTPPCRHAATGRGSARARCLCCAGRGAGGRRATSGTTSTRWWRRRSSARAAAACRAPTSTPSGSSTSARCASCARTTCRCVVRRGRSAGGKGLRRPRGGAGAEARADGRRPGGGLDLGVDVAGGGASDARRRLVVRRRRAGRPGDGGRGRGRGRLAGPAAAAVRARRRRPRRPRRPELLVRTRRGGQRGRAPLATARLWWRTRTRRRGATCSSCRAAAAADGLHSCAPSTRRSSARCAASRLGSPPRSAPRGRCARADARGSTGCRRVPAPPPPALARPRLEALAQEARTRSPRPRPARPPPRSRATAATPSTRRPRRAAGRR